AFGAANAYIGLKFGMTICASIPAAVISMAVLRVFFKQATVLENNIVQTVGSAGESLAAGVIFTIPAFFIWAAKYKYEYDFGISGWTIVALSLLGGAMGILLMIPLRKYLVEREHGRLRFPEGTACAEIIAAGDEGGSKAKTVFFGIGVGALYKILYDGFRLWPESPAHDFKTKQLDGATIGMDATPVLLGVGYIIGPRIAGLMLSGAVLGYIALAPLIKYIGMYIPEGINVLPADMAVADMGSADLRNYFIKYLGVGAVAVGGFVSLLKSMPTVVHSFSQGMTQIFKRGETGTAKRKRTDDDLPMWVVLVGTLLVALAIWALPGTNLQFIGVILALIFGFFFIIVAARIVGIVGSSSSPVSGMTIATLLVTCLILSAFGISGFSGMVTALSVGAVVCIAVCMSGDIAQDLKTGWLLGATPRRQQLTEFIGLAVSALTMGVVIFVLADTFGFVKDAAHPDPLLAPQANIMATLIEGIFQGQLPWILIISGGMIALSIELLGIGSLPVAIGLYLPLSLSTPIMAGGFLCWLVGKVMGRKDARAKIRQEHGILFGSGLVAGDALLGVIIAFIIMGSTGYKAFYDSLPDGRLDGTPGMLLSLAMFALTMAIYWFVVKRQSRS
ncbi:MAG: oligopeptide transporter, OPT family, partial [candidate division Zixibacteria bacterium]|nr:oligopeptide transporter, OPT family [candidate division Zixibacteria bacterium]